MEIKIFDYGMNGEGVGKINGKIVLVPNTLIDELVDIEIVEDNKNYSIGNLKNIIKPSSNRTQPVCNFYSQCGGCSLQHMNYDEQLKFKTLLVQKTLKKISGIDVCINKTVECRQTTHYRNKMSFSVSDLNCGLKKEGTKDVVNISHCPLCCENINKILDLFKVYIKTKHIQSIKNLVVREIENQILVGIVSSKEVDLNDFYSILSKHFSSIGLYLIINTRKDSVVLSGTIKHIDGIKEIKINAFDITYFVDLVGFHQTNLDIQDKLYNKVLEFISSNSNVLNGFSGQGLLSAILSKKAKTVIGIEINKSSHKSAETLKQQNNISNLQNICGDFHKYINKFKKNVDTLILDPTKKGCGKEVMNEIIGVENIIYISCNPIALSKDLNVIKNHYNIEEVVPFDMFPNTTSVETLVKLKLKK